MLPDERGGEGQRGTGEAVVLAGLWEAAGGARVSGPKRGSRSTAPTRVGAERLGRIFDRVSEVSGRVSERPKLPEGACRGTVASAALKHREGSVPRSSRNVFTTASTSRTAMPVCSTRGIRGVECVAWSVPQCRQRRCDG